MTNRYGLIRSFGLAGLLLTSAACVGPNVYPGAPDYPSAQGHGEHSEVSQNGAGYGEYARVIRVEPRYVHTEVPLHREECWDEPVPYQRVYHARYQSYTPIILGGILGGAIGNQFGKGSGRDALTVAGAALGASAGRDIAHGHSVAHPVYKASQRRCQVVTDYQQERRIDGYVVTYEYCGRTYTTETKTPPGEHIRVSVQPVPEPGNGF